MSVQSEGCLPLESVFREYRYGGLDAIALTKQLRKLKSLWVSKKSFEIQALTIVQRNVSAKCEQSLTKELNYGDRRETIQSYSTLTG